MPGGSTQAEVAAICDAAATSAGFDDFGDDWFLQPLSAWAEDLQQPDLTEFGRSFLRSQAVRDVARRLRVLAALDQHPEIAEVAIPPIVHITGLERSGTTLLHNLLALHPRARALLRWELMEPVPPPEAATHRTDPRIAAVQRSVDRLRGTSLEGMHWVNADEPEECVWGFIDAVSMLGQAASVCMPNWSRFLLESDMTPAFEHYRRLVQLLLWRHPVEPSGFLVLKAPQVGRSVATLASVFPELRFVITDRDPYRCFVSTAVLVEGVVDGLCIENPMTDDGARDRMIQSTGTLKLRAIADFTTASPERVTHLLYDLLVSDPPAAVRHAFAGGPGEGVDLTGPVHAFLEAQRRGARARPPATLPSMGYQRDQVWADPTIRSYCDRFGITPEHERLTGTT